jgi:hypothetical protein
MGKQGRLTESCGGGAVRTDTRRTVKGTVMGEGEGEGEGHGDGDEEVVFGGWMSMLVAMEGGFYFGMGRLRIYPGQGGAGDAGGLTGLLSMVNRTGIFRWCHARERSCRLCTSARCFQKNLRMSTPNWRWN